MAVNQEDIDANISGWLSTFASNAYNAFLGEEGSYLSLLSDDLDQFVGVADSVSDFAGNISLSGLLNPVESVVRENLTNLQLQAVEYLFNLDGGRADASSYARDIGSFLDEKTGSYASRAFGLISQVVQGGQAAYLALAYNQIFIAQQQVNDVRTLITNQINGCQAMIRVLNSIYGDHLYRKLDANRRAAIAFLINSERNFDAVALEIERRGVFNQGRYRSGMAGITGAQASLAAGSRRDRIRAQGTSYNRREPSLDVLRAIPELVIVDDAFESAVDEARAALADQEANIDIPFDVPEIVTDEMGTIFQRFRDAASIAASMTTDRENILHGHRRMLLRLRAIQELENEIGAARQQMAPIRDEIIRFSDRIEALREEMQGDKTRLELMNQTSNWLLRLSFMKYRMENTVRPESFTAISQQNILNDDYRRIAQRLADIEIVSTEEIENIIQEGRDVVGQFASALTGRPDIPQELIAKINSYRARLVQLNIQYGKIQSAISNVRRHRHSSVDQLNEFINGNPILYGGIRLLIDSGRWRALGCFNAQLVTEAGLLEFALRKSILNLVLPPSTQNLIDRLLELLRRDKERAEEEATMLEDNVQALESGIQSTISANAERYELLGHASELIAPLQDIRNSGEGVLSEDARQSVQDNTFVLALG